LEVVLSEEPEDLVAGEPNRGFTVRAVVTGALLGSLLSICNVYLGLKIGWGMNMSITAALGAFAIWKVVSAISRGRGMGIGENNISQTGASAAAAISSAGLVAPIPAWTIITGQTLSYPMLMGWVLSVGLVGVVVGATVYHQLIKVDKLPFPGGLATGQTLKEMYAHGSEALARAKKLLAGMVAGAVSKLSGIFFALHPVGLPFAIPAATGAAVKSYTANNLTLALDPSALMVAVGGIIGMRACMSMLFGGVVAWGLLLPWALDMGWAEAGAPDKSWFSNGVKWLLWPGVAMMVCGSITSFAFSWRSILAALTPAAAGAPTVVDPGAIPRNALLGVGLAVLVFSSFFQIYLFDIKPWLAVLAVLLSFVMALVAGRVTGETNVTPVGAMGKVTQLTFGILDPSNVSSNLMAANVTGGAASQCGDLLHDLKTGSMLGSWPKHQAVSQAVGVVAGAIVGCAAYMILIPDPKGMLLTDEWAAPAVATWKAVAEVFANGVSAMPPGTQPAMLAGAIVGVVGTILEKTLPKNVVRYMPSTVSVGLAFTLQVYTAISFAIGAILMELLRKVAPEWTNRFGIAVCAGVIAGESLVGAGDALIKTFTSMFGG
jgi:putative OPT family oligopeptide transporter